MKGHFIVAVLVTVFFNPLEASSKPYSKLCGQYVAKDFNYKNYYPVNKSNNTSTGNLLDIELFIQGSRDAHVLLSPFMNNSYGYVELRFGSNNNTISTLSMDSGAIKANSTEGSVLSNSTVLPVRIRVTKQWLVLVTLNQTETSYLSYKSGFRLNPQYMSLAGFNTTFYYNCSTNSNSNNTKPMAMLVIISLIYVYVKQANDED